MIKLTELELCKKFAELDGVGEYLMHRDEMYIVDFKGDLYVNSVAHSKYNPITDMALNCVAMDKYNIETEYVSPNLMYVSTSQYLENARIPVISIKVNIKSELPRARIECILKSKGII